MVRSRGLEPPRVAPLAPQASASTNSATTAVGGRPLAAERLKPDVTNRPPGNKGSAAGRRAIAQVSCSVGSAHVFEPLRQPLDLDRNAITADHDDAPRHREIVGQDRDLVILG